MSISSSMDGMGSVGYNGMTVFLAFTTTLMDMDMDMAAARERDELYILRYYY